MGVSMSRTNLLIVDDDRLYGEALQALAVSLGFGATLLDRPLALASVIQPVDKAQPGIGLIVLDLKMPELDGIQVLRQLAQMKCGIPIILSSSVERRVLESAQRLGREHGLTIAGISPKPLSADALQQYLQEHCRLSPELSPGELAAALDEDRLVVHYQPKLDLRAGRIVGVEALVRCQHPTGGLIMPDQFIAMAEQNGLIERLTYGVVQKSLSQLKQWKSDGLDLGLAVNLSPLLLDDIDVPDRIAQHCVNCRVPRNIVTIEVTETALSRDAVKAADVLTRFRLNDFNLAIDDLGAGHSSLMQLLNQPFSEVKIDRQFVMHLNAAQDSRAIVDAIVGLARSLQIKSVAEGVEDAAGLAFLMEKGCDEAQGYFISRPLPAEAVAGFVRGYQPPLIARRASAAK
jgi:EAL domain-containing protein (putative c-di-GMP-specific phosphodiesterase class I)